MSPLWRLTSTATRRTSTPTVTLSGHHTCCLSISSATVCPVTTFLPLSANMTDLPQEFRSRPLKTTRTKTPCGCSTIILLGKVSHNPPWEGQAVGSSLRPPTIKWGLGSSLSFKALRRPLRASVGILGTALRKVAPAYFFPKGYLQCTNAVISIFLSSVVCLRLPLRTGCLLRFGRSMVSRWSSLVV